MPAPAIDTIDDEPVEFQHEGVWTHFSCPACGAMCEIEDDLVNGEDVECDACGQTGVIRRAV